MVERLAGRDPSLLVHGQHPLQQVDKLPSVHLKRKKNQEKKASLKISVPDQ
jgi:hypothetical protein